MGGEGVHIVETLLKIILSADLLPFLKLGSITNSHTNNPNYERGKSWSNTISCSFFFVFFVFLFLGLLGEIFTLTNIHWHSFHPSTFYIDVFIELLILATEPSEKMYSKNSFITHLFRHSIGLMFYWYAEVLVPHI